MGDSPSASPTRLPLSKCADHSGLNDADTELTSDEKAAKKKIDTISEAYKTIIEALGVTDPHREGLERTPLRAAKALCFFTKGYEENLKCE